MALSNLIVMSLCISVPGISQKIDIRVISVSKTDHLGWGPLCSLRGVLCKPCAEILVYFSAALPCVESECTLRWGLEDGV